MPKQLNQRLNFQIDVSQARQQLRLLQAQMDALTNTSGFSRNFQNGLTSEIMSATKAATLLKTQLTQAINPLTGNLNLTKFNDQLMASQTSIRDYKNQLSALGTAGNQAFNGLARSIATAETPLLRTSQAASAMWTALGNAARWTATSTAIHGVMSTAASAMNYVKNLDSSLNDIRIVTGQTQEQMNTFATKANEAAKALNTTTNNYAKAALIYYQQGLSNKQVEERTETTIKLANVSGQSAKKVSDQLTAVWNNFYDGSKSLEYYADVMTALGASTASSSEEIARGLQKFSSIAQTTGLSYEYATSALSTIVAATRQSADSVGTSLKTLFSRFQGLSLGDTLEDGTSLNKYSKALNTIGVSVLGANGQLKDMDSILSELGEKWQFLNKAQQAALAQTLGGTRGYTTMMSLMDNWDQFQQNLMTAQGAQGTLQKQADIYSQSWEAASAHVRAASETIYKNLLNDDFFKGLTNGFGTVLDGIGAITNGLGGFKGTMAAISNTAFQVFGDQIGGLFGNIGLNARSLIMGQQDVIDLKTQARDALREGIEFSNYDQVNQLSNYFNQQMDQRSLKYEQLQSQGKIPKYMEPVYQGMFSNINAMADDAIASAEQMFQNQGYSNIAQQEYLRQINGLARENNDQFNRLIQDDIRPLYKTEYAATEAGILQGMLDPNKTQVSIGQAKNLAGYIMRMDSGLERMGESIKDSINPLEYYRKGIQELDQQFANKAVNGMTQEQYEQGLQKIFNTPITVNGQQQNFNEVLQSIIDNNVNIKEDLITTLMEDGKMSRTDAEKSLSGLFSDSGMTAQERAAVLQKIGGTALAGTSMGKNLNIQDATKKTVAFSSAFAGTLGLISSGAQTFNALGQAVKVFSKDGATASEYLSSIASVGMSMGMMLKPIQNMFGKDNFSTPFSMFGKPTAFTKGQMGLAGLGLTAALVAGSWAIKEGAKNSPEGIQKAFVGQVATAQQLSAEAKTEYEQAEVNRESQAKLLDQLYSTPTGTSEFTNTLINNNDVAQQLIDTYGLEYGTGYKYGKYGEIVFNESALDEAAKTKQQESLDRQVGAAQLKAAAKLYELEHPNVGDIYEDLPSWYTQNKIVFEDGISNTAQQFVEQFKTWKATQPGNFSAKDLLTNNWVGPGSEHPFTQTDIDTLMNTFGVSTPEQLYATIDRLGTIDSTNTAVINDTLGTFSKNYSQKEALLQGIVEYYGATTLGEDTLNRELAAKLFSEQFSPSEFANYIDFIGKASQNTFLEQWTGKGINDWYKLLYGERPSSKMSEEEIGTLVSEGLLSQGILHTEDLLKKVTETTGFGEEVAKKMGLSEIESLTKKAENIKDLQLPGFAGMTRKETNKYLQHEINEAISDKAFDKVDALRSVKDSYNKIYDNLLQDIADVTARGFKDSELDGETQAAELGSQLQALAGDLIFDDQKALYDGLAQASRLGNNTLLQLEELAINDRIKNPYEAAEKEFSDDFRNLLKDFNFDKSLSGIQSNIQLERLAKNNEAYQKMITSVIKDMGGEKGLFEKLYNSSGFESVMDKLKTQFETTGQITAQNIDALAKKQEDLNTLINIGSQGYEGANINSAGIATALEGMVSGALGTEDLTSSLISAFSTGGQTEAYNSAAFQVVDNLDLGRSGAEYLDYFRDMGKAFFSLQKEGWGFNNDQFKTMVNLLGNKDIKDAFYDINRTSDGKFKDLMKSMPSYFTDFLGTMAGPKGKGGGSPEDVSNFVRNLLGANPLGNGADSELWKQLGFEIDSNGNITLGEGITSDIFIEELTQALIDSGMESEAAADMASVLHGLVTTSGKTGAALEDASARLEYEELIKGKTFNKDAARDIRKENNGDANFDEFYNQLFVDSEKISQVTQEGLEKYVTDNERFLSDYYLKYNPALGKLTGENLIKQVLNDFSGVLIDQYNFTKNPSLQKFVTDHGKGGLQNGKDTTEDDFKKMAASWGAYSKKLDEAGNLIGERFDYNQLLTMIQAYGGTSANLEQWIRQNPELFQGKLFGYGLNGEEIAYKEGMDFSEFLANYNKTSRAGTLVANAINSMIPSMGVEYARQAGMYFWNDSTGQYELDPYGQLRAQYELDKGLADKYKQQQQLEEEFAKGLIGRDEYDTSKVNLQKDIDDLIKNGANSTKAKSYAGVSTSEDGGGTPPSPTTSGGSDTHGEIDANGVSDRGYVSGTTDDHFFGWYNGQQVRMVQDENGKSKWVYESDYQAQKKAEEAEATRKEAEAKANQEDSDAEYKADLARIAEQEKAVHDAEIAARNLGREQTAANIAAREAQLKAEAHDAEIAARELGRRQTAETIKARKDELAAEQAAKQQAAEEARAAAEAEGKRRTDYEQYKALAAENPEATAAFENMYGKDDVTTADLQRFIDNQYPEIAAEEARKAEEARQAQIVKETAVLQDEAAAAYAEEMARREEEAKRAEEENYIAENADAYDAWLNSGHTGSIEDFKAWQREEAARTTEQNRIVEADEQARREKEAKDAAAYEEAQLQKERDNLVEQLEAEGIDDQAYLDAIRNGEISLEEGQAKLKESQTGTTVTEPTTDLAEAVNEVTESAEDLTKATDDNISTAEDFNEITEDYNAEAEANYALDWLNQPGNEELLREWTTNSNLSAQDFVAQTQAAWDANPTQTPETTQPSETESTEKSTQEEADYYAQKYRAYNDQLLGGEGSADSFAEWMEKNGLNKDALNNQTLQNIYNTLKDTNELTAEQLDLAKETSEQGGTGTNRNGTGSTTGANGESTGEEEENNVDMPYSQKPTPQYTSGGGGGDGGGGGGGQGGGTGGAPTTKEPTGPFGEWYQKEDGTWMHWEESATHGPNNEPGGYVPVDASQYDANPEETPSPPSSPPSNSGGCFAAGTQILMANGQNKNIEDIKINEIVIAYDEKIKEFVAKKVTKSYVHHNTPQMVKLTFNTGDILKLTPGHPLYSINGWKSLDIEDSLWEHGTIATLLQVNDTIVNINQNAQIINIEYLNIGLNYDSYNIEVEECHTFLANGFVAHNRKQIAVGQNNARILQFASGKEAEIAVTGELGPELRVKDDGSMDIVGQHGREYVWVEPSDRIYTAAQTASILGNHSIEELQGFAEGFNNKIHGYFKGPSTDWGGSTSSGGGGGGYGGGGDSGKVSEGSLEKEEPVDPRYDPYTLKERDIITRYYTILQQIDDITRAVEHFGKVADRAWGQERLKAIEKQTSLYEEQLAAQKKYVNEIERYLEKDRKALESMMSEFAHDYTYHGDEGAIDPFDLTNMQEYYENQKKGQGASLSSSGGGSSGGTDMLSSKLSASGGGMTAGQEDEDRIYDYGHRIPLYWEGAEYDEHGVMTNYSSFIDALIDAYNNNAYANSQSKEAQYKFQEMLKDIQMYTDTLNLYEQQKEVLWDLQNAILDSKILKVVYEVQYQNELDVNALREINYEFGKVRDNVYRAAEAVDTYSIKMDYLNKSNGRYVESINDILATYSGNIVNGEQHKLSETMYKLVNPGMDKGELWFDLGLMKVWQMGGGGGFFDGLGLGGGSGSAAMQLKEEYEKHGATVIVDAIKKGFLTQEEATYYLALEEALGITVESALKTLQEHPDWDLSSAENLFQIALEEGLEVDPQKMKEAKEYARKKVVESGKIYDPITGALTDRTISYADAQAIEDNIFEPYEGASIKDILSYLENFHKVEVNGKTYYQPNDKEAEINEDYLIPLTFSKIEIDKTGDMTKKSKEVVTKEVQEWYDELNAKAPDLLIDITPIFDEDGFMTNFREVLKAVNDGNAKMSHEMYDLLLHDQQAFFEKFSEFTLDNIDFQNLTAETVTQLENTLDTINTTLETIQANFDTVMNTIGDSVKSFAKKLNTELAEFDYFGEVISAYQNIVNLTNRRYNNFDSTFIKGLQESALENGINKVSGNKAVYDSLLRQQQKANMDLEMAQAQLAVRDSLRQNMAEEEFEKWEKDLQADIDLYEDNLKLVNDKVEDAHKQMLKSWEDALSKVVEVYNTAVDEAMRAYNESFSPFFNTLELLQAQFERQKALEDYYVDDYQRIHDLNALDRALEQSILDTDNLKSKSRLRDLQKEINDLQDKGIELSSYDLDILEKKYKLELARQALEDAKDAKSLVRLSRDNNGNWSYVYTSNDIEVEEAEQHYEDAIREMEAANENYIESLESQILQVIQSSAEAIQALNKDDFDNEEDFWRARQNIIDSAAETARYLNEQLNNAFNNNDFLNPYIIDIYDKNLHNLTNSWDDMTIAALLGADSLDSALSLTLNNLNGLSDSIGEAYEEYSEGQAQVYEAAGVNIAHATEYFDEGINTILTKSSEELDIIDSKIDRIEKAFNETMNSIVNYIQKYYDKMYTITDQESYVFLSLYKDAIANLIEISGEYVKPEQLDFTSTIDSDFELNEIMEVLREYGKVQVSDYDSQGNRQIYTLEQGTEETARILAQWQDNIDKRNALKVGFDLDTRDEYNQVIEYLKNHGQVYVSIDGEIKKLVANNEEDMAWLEEKLEAIKKAEEKPKYVYKGDYDEPSNPTPKEEPFYKDGKTYASYDEWQADPNNYTGTWDPNKPNEPWKENPNHYDTGGYTGVFANTGMYTGEWPNGSVRRNGRLAWLHQKELVLNAHDTENFLDAMGIVRQLDNLTSWMANGLGDLFSPRVEAEEGTLQQEVHIDASFPNVTDHNEIEEAFGNLVNLASQYANRKTFA